ATERCGYFSRERVALCKLRHKTLWNRKQRPLVANIRSYIRFIGARLVCHVGKRIVSLRSDAKTNDQARSVHQPSASDPVVFCALDGNFYAEARGTQTWFVSAPALESVLW